MVLVDENIPRGEWVLGRVIGVRRSADGLVRSVVVRANNSEYVRPVSKLVMLVENEELP